MTGIPHPASQLTKRKPARTVVLLAVAALTAVPPASAQLPEPEWPRTAAVVGAGVRDAGDFGRPVWIVAAGIRRQTVRDIGWNLGFSHTRTDDSLCPADPGVPCTPRSAARITSVELGAEFLYGTFRVQPYGVVSAGVAHLSRAADDLNRVGAVYTTGLGLSARAAPRAWVFAEGRWRQEMFGSLTARGPAGVVGVRIGL